MSPAHLAVAIALDGLTVASWRAWVVERIAADPRFAVRTVLLSSAGDAPPPPAPARGGAGAALLRAYERADRERRGRTHDAFSTADVTALLPEGSRIRPAGSAEPGETPHDLVVDLGTTPVHPDDADAPPLGTWSIVLDDDDPDAVGPPLFWATHRRSPTASSSVRVRGAAAGGEVTIQRAVSRVDPGSLHETRNAVTWKMAELLVRRLGEVARRGWNAMRADALPTPAPAPARPAAPGTTQMLGFLGRLGHRKVRRRVARSVAPDQWFLAYREIPAGGVGQPSDAPMRFIDPPAGLNYADPMIIEEGGVPFVFFEEWRATPSRAWISYLTLGDDGRPSAPRIALERDYHLSYPFLHREGGEIFMVPETRANRTIELYRAARFPDRWELVQVLVPDVSASDSTLLRHEGRLWMLTNIAHHGAMPWDELHVYWADSVHGPWTAHPRNPVVCDVRSARSAGRPFAIGDALLRPAQDCSVEYGGSMVLNRITRLTEEDYAEEVVGRIVPRRSTGTLRTHTHCAGERFEVFDGMRIAPKLTPRRPGELGRRAAIAPVEWIWDDPGLAGRWPT